jgi:hypothetical protein
MPNLPLRQLIRSAARAAVVAAMGPVVLVLGGTGQLTWPGVLHSLRYTGPLATVLFIGFALLEWQGSPAEVRDGAPRDPAAPPPAG